jgi:large subunit ribosomal protein L19
MKSDLPHFKVGDDLEIIIKMDEGRNQSFKGTVIARRNRGLRSSVTLRKTSHGVPVERVFPIHSPLLTIVRLKKGRVRRAKLYYLRKLAGRAARVKEDVRSSS